MSKTKIAVYWDFENLHLSLANRNPTNGKIQPSYTTQEKLLDVAVVMDYVVSLGDIVIYRAYNNWQYFGAYRNDLLTYAIDLIQLYPKGLHAKSGADIRLALDALEDTYHHPHITHVVIIGGDSDYISVAQKLKSSGKLS